MSEQEEGAIGRVVLGRSGVLRLRRGHPWVKAEHLQSVDAQDGDVVRVEGPADATRGFAVFHGDSHIALRMISFDPKAALDAGFWRERLDAAIARRVDSLAPGAEVCRWVHSEADGMPGLIVDRLGSVAVLQAGCRWADSVARDVADRLVERHGVTGVLARHDGAFRKPEGLSEGVDVLAGEVPDEVETRWGQVRRLVAPASGQKTGAYIDQRLNQEWAADVLPVGSALDLFCNEGGFALQLAARGSKVTAVDSSRSALEHVRRNAELNGLSDSIETIPANVFEHLRMLERESRRFDGVVLDPPALAKRRRDVKGAERGYRDLNLRALRVLRVGGRLVTCSCSHHMDQAAFRTIVGQAAAAAGLRVELLEERGAATCHPRLLTFPESGYLKVLLLEVRGKA